LQYQGFRKVVFPLISSVLAACSGGSSAPPVILATYVVSPYTASLTLGQTAQFSSNAPSGVAIHWSVDGIVGGNPTVGVITGTGFYTAPNSGGGAHAIAATDKDDSTKFGKAIAAVTDLQGIYTYHNDLARTGLNAQEYALTPITVGSSKFGKRWSCNVDGQVNAQPLYVANLAISGGIHNVLIVATMHDSVYAFDADDPGCHTFWQVSLLGAGATPMPVADTQCPAFLVEIGIVSTPVIDPSTNALYLVAASKEGGDYIQRLHSISVISGEERPGSPTVIQASLINASGATVEFTAFHHLQRAGLTLVGGGVEIAWASYCDFPTYWGWVMRYDATSLAQTAVFNVAPNGGEGGIWMSGAAPSVDSKGDLFLSTGNGTFDDLSSVVPAVAPQNDFGMSFLKFDPALLAVKDFFTPAEESTWSTSDEDISSSGVTLLPDGIGPSAHPNLLVGADKLGHIWLIDRDNMQRFHSSSDPVVQFLNLPGCVSAGSCVLATAAVWNNTVYIAVGGGRVMALPLRNGLLPADGGNAAPASKSSELYPFPSPTPVVSASPRGNAVVWALDNSANGTINAASSTQGTAILRAYDATNLATTLYSSAVLPTDAAGPPVKFTAPVVANGHVYVGGGGQVTVYGLAP
jgi:hypothetical protein